MIKRASVSYVRAKKGLTFIIPALIVLMLAACAGPGDMAEPSLVTMATVPAVDVPVDLSLEALGNLTYRGILDEPVTLSAGWFEGEPFVAGGASRPTVSLLADPVAYGDLNGDGREDAAVLLASDSGGSGSFIYLATVQSRDGVPDNMATLLLGDRVQVRSLAVEGERLVVRLLSHAPGDPACCPSLEMVREFTLEGETLVEVE
jgi:hypothetical protein